MFLFLAVDVPFMDPSNTSDFMINTECNGRIMILRIVFLFLVWFQLCFILLVFISLFWGFLFLCCCFFGSSCNSLVTSNFMFLKYMFLITPFVISLYAWHSKKQSSISSLWTASYKRQILSQKAVFPNGLAVFLFCAIFQFIIFRKWFFFSLKARSIICLA